MIKFGTSGFRGVLADNFTKENVQKVAYALCTICDDKSKIIPVGYDNRFMGLFFAKWMCEVLTAYGFNVKLFEKPTPSPLIAYETKVNNLNYGIHLTASHNPYYYNGVKIFMTGGRETTAEINEKLEKIANEISIDKVKTLDFDKAVIAGKITLTQDFKPYCDAILNLVDVKKIKQNKIKVLFNNMNGSSAECAKYLLDALGVEYEIMRSEIEPYFGYGLPAPYVNNLDDQITRMKQTKSDIGVAVDGDGDRVTFLDENGTPHDCNYISAVVYDYYLENKRKGCAVKNCALTEVIARLAALHGQKTVDAKVGFKNIAEKILENPDAVIGIETNGFAISDHVLHKDGLLALVLMTEILSVKQKTINQLIEEVKRKVNFQCAAIEYAYPITDEKKAEITQLVFDNKMQPVTPDKIEKVSYADGAKFTFKDGYWVVIRFSGNENVVRLFSEMPTREKAEEYITILEDFVGVKEKQ